MSEQDEAIECLYQKDYGMFALCFPQAAGKDPPQKGHRMS